MAAIESDIDIGGITLRLRESGDAGGAPVMHFHGTPGSRLELAWADELAHPRWLAENIPSSRLDVRHGEGHLLALAHLEEMLKALVAA